MWVHSHLPLLPPSASPPLHGCALSAVGKNCVGCHQYLLHFITSPISTTTVFNVSTPPSPSAASIGLSLCHLHRPLPHYTVVLCRPSANFRWVVDYIYFIFFFNLSPLPSPRQHSSTSVHPPLLPPPPSASPPLHGCIASAVDGPLSIFISTR